MTDNQELKTLFYYGLLSKQLGGKHLCEISLKYLKPFKNLRINYFKGSIYGRSGNCHIPFELFLEKGKNPFFMWKVVLSFKSKQ